MSYYVLSILFLSRWSENVMFSNFLSRLSAKTLDCCLKLITDRVFGSNIIERYFSHIRKIQGGRFLHLLEWIVTHHSINFEGTLSAAQFFFRLSFLVLPSLFAPFTLQWQRFIQNIGLSENPNNGILNGFYVDLAFEFFHYFAFVSLFGLLISSREEHWSKRVDDAPLPTSDIIHFVFTVLVEFAKVFALNFSSSFFLCLVYVIVECLSIPHLILQIFLFNSTLQKCIERIGLYIRQVFACRICVKHIRYFTVFRK